ncbi:MAG TPA: hypothetical protein PLB18_24885, partial [Acidobacteriota bacterium]|nr:hypothetical protein [Acidobacteriota bacterium]
MLIFLSGFLNISSYELFCGIWLMRLFFLFPGLVERSDCDSGFESVKKQELPLNLVLELRERIN